MQVPGWLALTVGGGGVLFPALNLLLRRWIPRLVGDMIVAIRAIRRLRAELRGGQSPERPALSDKEDQAAG
ncbi:hypothetical protein [Kitasatospora sp. NPDC057198]|uniref:hypothetical protein n=1 Tax=Kitasatospora sp. NPDC057198 TaxID=3346046 RepID=UPI00363EE95B